MTTPTLPNMTAAAFGKAVQATVAARTVKGPVPFVLPRISIDDQEAYQCVALWLGLQHGYGFNPRTAGVRYTIVSLERVGLRKVARV